MSDYLIQSTQITSLDRRCDATTQLPRTLGYFSEIFALAPSSSFSQETSEFIKTLDKPVSRR